MSPRKAGSLLVIGNYRFLTGGPVVRPFLIATPCLALLLTGHPFAQEPRQPSRQDILERDGIIWGNAAAWGVPFQENLSEDAKIAGLSKLWMEVKINFPHSRRRSCPSRDRQSPRMLVGPRCLSATDVFAETFRRLQRGKLIGEPDRRQYRGSPGVRSPRRRLGQSGDIGGGWVRLDGKRRSTGCPGTPHGEGFSCRARCRARGGAGRVGGIDEAAVVPQPS